MSKNNSVINFLNQPLDIMIFIFKHQIQNIKIFENILPNYSFESMICLRKVNSLFNFLYFYLDGV